MKNKKPVSIPGGLPSDQAVAHTVRILASFNR